MKPGRWGVIVAMVVISACSGSGDENAEPLVVEATTTTDAAGATDDAAGDGPDAGADGDEAAAGESGDVGSSEPEPDAEPAADDVEEPDESTVDPGDTDGAEATDAAEADDGEGGGGGEVGTQDPDAADVEADAAPSSSDSGDPGGTPTPTAGSGGTTSGGQSTSGGSGTSTLAAAGNGTTVSGPNLVPDDEVEPSCGASLDNPCLPATNGHQPYEAVSMGEYQTDVVVPDGAILDVYFDQSRSEEQMRRLCREMGGVFHTRPYDGSPWGGWGYCAHVDYP